MPNYVDIIAEYFPNSEVDVAPGGDPTVYGDLVWISAPVLQATLDQYASHVGAVIVGSNRIRLVVRNETGSTITKGTPVYVIGEDPLSGNILIGPADADVGSAMPAVGILPEDILNNTTGHVVRAGLVSGTVAEPLDTASWSIGDSLYVGNTAGVLSNARPMGSTALVQKMAQVLKAHATDGVIQIVSAGRTNDIPNLAQNKVWIGDANGNPVEGDMVSQVTMQQNDSNVAGTPHNIINIEGSATVADEGGGKVTINVTGGGGGGGDLAVVQARRTTTIASIPLTWTDLTYDTTDVESQDSTIEHDNVNRDRMLIKETGLYELHYVLNSDDEVQGRMRVNDTTVIPGSTQASGDQSDAVNVITPNNVTVYYNLTAGDFVTVQIQAATTSEILNADALFLIQKMDGVKGDPGPQGLQGTAGSGSTIAVREEGVDLPNTPHTILNLIGGDLQATDAGGGIANITFSAQGGDVAACQARRTTGYTLSTSWSDITLDTTDTETDADVIEHSSGATDRIVIKDDGVYLIGYNVNFNEISGSDENVYVEARVRSNDSTIIPGSWTQASQLTDGSLVGNGSSVPLNHSFICTCTSGDWVTFQLYKYQQTGTVTVSAKADITIYVVKLEATHGRDGVDGSNAITLKDGGVNVVNTPHGSLDFVGDKLAVTDQGGGVAQVDSTHDHDDVYYTESEIDDLIINGGNF